MDYKKPEMAKRIIYKNLPFSRILLTYNNLNTKLITYHIISYNARFI